jgi:hypothetical protein
MTNRHYKGMEFAACGKDRSAPRLRTVACIVALSMTMAGGAVRIYDTHTLAHNTTDQLQAAAEGKGTHARRACAKLCEQAISVADFFAEAAARDDEVGTQARLAVEHLRRKFSN